MDNISSIQFLLRQVADIPKEKTTVFFKTGVGQYAQHDQFIGATVPAVRKIAKKYLHIPLEEIELLLNSSINEERLLALLILVNQYQKAEHDTKIELYELYLRNLPQVNNWNLVDSSAHLIIGAHLVNADKQILLQLAESELLWNRRIAIVATWYFIRKNDLEWTFKIAQILLNDHHDLIHKAVGWMLREAGKKDQNCLKLFLNEHAFKMPRTMLRYAIEKFPEHQRKEYLLRSKS